MKILTDQVKDNCNEFSIPWSVLLKPQLSLLYPPFPYFLSVHSPFVCSPFSGDNRSGCVFFSCKYGRTTKGKTNLYDLHHFAGPNGKTSATDVRNGLAFNQYCVSWGQLDMLKSAT